MTRLEPPPIQTLPSPAPDAVGDESLAEALDPAQRSLADALRVSFGILKLLIILLVITYLFSGIFRVKEQEVAVLLVFGKIVGQAGQQVYPPGWYLGPPPPFGAVIRVPVAPEQLSINQTFWYEVKDHELGKRASELTARPLNPLNDGSLVTGDANIVHARFQVTYGVGEQGVVDFVENLGDRGMVRALVRGAVERGIVHAVAQTEADELIGGRAKVGTARLRAQELLDGLRTGIQIISFNTEATEMPLSVLRAYKEVSTAENRKAHLIDQARTEYAQILGQAAGPAYSDLYQLVRDLGAASARAQADEAERLTEQLNRSIADLRMSGQRGGKQIGGEVAEIVNQANTRRNEIVQSTKAAAERFEGLLQEYRRTPRLLQNKLWLTLREKVFTGDVEIIYVPDGNIRVDTSGDPEISRKSQEQRLRKAADEAAEKRRTGQ